MEDDAVCRVAESFDFHAFGIVARVAAGYADHCGGGRRGDFQFVLVESAVSDALEQFDDVRFDARQHRFGFGIAHADVVFDHIRIALHVHQSDENKSFVVDLIGREPFDGRFDDGRYDLVHKFCVGERNRRYGPHAAGVRAGVPDADPLVIFCDGQHAEILAVGGYENRTFDSRQELFDHDRVAGVPETPVEHRIQLGFRRFERIDDQHSFSGGQSVGFQHVRRFQRFEKGFGFVGVFLCETTVGGRRNTVADHEILGEILTPFEPRPDRRRADHGDVADLMVFLEKIVNPFYQRFFRADDDHVDVVRQHELFDGREIDRIDVHVRPAYGGACVPRSDIQPRQPLALSDFPCKGMFTAP